MKYINNLWKNWMKLQPHKAKSKIICKERITKFHYYQGQIIVSANILYFFQTSTYKFAKLLNHLSTYTSLVWSLFIKPGGSWCPDSWTLTLSLHKRKVKGSIPGCSTLVFSGYFRSFALKKLKNIHFRFSGVDINKKPLVLLSKTILL